MCVLCLNGKYIFSHVVITHITPTIIKTIELKKTSTRVIKYQGVV